MKRDAMDPMSPEWRTQAAIAALERRREVRIIVFGIMLHLAIFMGLVAAMVTARLHQALVALMGAALGSAGWQLVCVIRANCRIARLKEELRR